MIMKNRTTTGPGQDIWVVIEQRDGDIAPVSLEVLSMACGIAARTGSKVTAAVLGSHTTAVTNPLTEQGAEKIYFIDHAALREYDAEPCAAALLQLFERVNPGMILFGATLQGNDMACRIAPRLGSPLVTNCTDISLDKALLPLYTKLTHGGNLASTFACKEVSPQMATVVPGAFEIKKPDVCNKSEIVNFHPAHLEKEKQLKRMELVKVDSDKIELDEADIIVAGGRGIGSPENFELVKGLANILGGAAGSSLGAVDDGLAPRRNLVGQTGMTVTPALYLACGISGSIYHVLGMKDAKAIVAINTNRTAEIFNYADMGIVGDAVEILTAIINRLAASPGPRNDGI